MQNVGGRRDGIRWSPTAPRGTIDFQAWRFPTLTPMAFQIKRRSRIISRPTQERSQPLFVVGVDVKKVERQKGRVGFLVETSHGMFEANSVVAATGPFQCPRVPAVVPDISGVLQIHSVAYRNPDQLPKGAVLIIGAGSSGVQIAEELLLAGKRVYLSVGPHERPPRAYRTRDYCWWLGVLGKWDLETRIPGREHVTISVTGARGGHTIDFRRLAAQGITLLGVTESCKDQTVTVKADLADNIAQGDASYMALLDEADAYVIRNGIDLPEEPGARKIEPDPDCITNPILELNLAHAGVTSIIWATGFRSDYSWLRIDTFDDKGQPKHQRGISAELGLYFLGLRWQSRRGSAFIWGVWHDAKYIADRIVTRRRYLEYASRSKP